MRIEESYIITGPSHSAEVWTTVRIDDADVEIGPMTSVATEAEVDNAVNQVYVQNLGQGAYRYVVSVEDDFMGGLRFKNADLGLILDSDLTTTATPAPSGAYHTQADAEEQRGVENIRRWSTKGAEGGPDVGAINRSIRDARTIINSRLITRFIYPLVSIDGTPVDQDTSDILNRIRESIGAFQLYSARGLDVEDDPVANVLKTEYDAALAELDKYVSTSLYINLKQEAHHHDLQAQVVDPLKPHTDWTYE